MSRIEEALRRAAVSGEGAVAALKDYRTPVADTQTLTQYPQETPGAARRPRRADVLAAPPVSLRPQPAPHLGPFPQELDAKLVLAHATPVAVEQYRRLAATLHELQTAHGTKTLMVTSTLPREGKSLTVANLAMTLSESYRWRVLLIDADLRRPSVHEIFQLPVTDGLSEGLRSTTSALSIVRLSEHLSVLPGGRPDSNPMAGLTSERMQTLLAEAAAAFDWVLLDAPPVGIMPDANLLARLTEGVIFVVAAGATPYPLVQRAIADIGRESIVGVVLNRMDPAAIPEGGYYEQYYGAVDPTRS